MTGIKKVKSVLLYEQVAEQIERIIFSGQYKKGALLPSERELIELTGVSRITVREALSHLAELGIIETRRGKGSTVLVSAQELLQITNDRDKYQHHRRDFETSTDTRILIEPEIARQVALTATPEERARIGQFLLGGAEPKPRRDGGSQVLEGFHRAIVGALQNPILLELFDSLTELESHQQQLLITPPSQQESTALRLDEDHMKIYKAIESGNGEFAYFYMKEHLLFLKETYQRYFDHYYQ